MTYWVSCELGKVIKELQLSVNTYFIPLNLLHDHSSKVYTYLESLLKAWILNARRAEAESHLRNSRHCVTTNVVHELVRLFKHS